MLRALIYLLYWSVQALVLPLVPVYAAWRVKRNRAWLTNLGERLGILPSPIHRTCRDAVWLHAVSVGEVISAAGLVRRLRARLPCAPVYVSTTTLAGRAIAEERLAGLAAGVFYAPVDYRFAVRRVLRALQPAVVVVLETEIWPNLFRESARWGAGLLVANGRISDRTIRRYRGMAWFFRHVLSFADQILVQSEQDRRRYLELGAPPDRLRAAGNLKYDFEPREVSPPADIAAFLARTSPGAVWIAASTMPPAHAADLDEDDAVIGAFVALRQSRPDLLMILAPRRPERFETAAAKLERAGIGFARRSRLAEDTPPAPVLLLDSIGELSSLFPLAHVVFMGGSLAQRGGHNILEPAFFSRAIIVGPHMENFAAIAEELRGAGAMVTIPAAPELAGSVLRLLDDAAARAELGARARALAEARRGATARVTAEIERLYGQAVPRRVRSLVRDLPLWPLAAAWRAGGAMRAAWLRSRRGRAAAPVISVGGIGMGGAGKSPFVLWLAGELGRRGLRPAILTRGYRRASAEAVTLLAPGETAPVERTGDEAQILLRAGVAAVGIGADRLRAARAMEVRLRPDVFVLDDGFQHHRLERDLDIVLIDALDPLAGGALFPLGRLREPPAALARAGALVITRAPRCRPLDGLRALLGELNPRAPIFEARLKPLAWVDHATGAEHPPDTAWEGAGAFCGLGHPGSFWSTLEELGIRPEWRRAFPDHHRYRGAEIVALRQQARVLLTTEKDAVKLPAPVAGLYWLKVALEVDGANKLLELVSSISSSRRLNSSPAE